MIRSKVHCHGLERLAALVATGGGRVLLWPLCATRGVAARLRGSSVPCRRWFWAGVALGHSRQASVAGGGLARTTLLSYRGQSSLAARTYCRVTVDMVAKQGGPLFLFPECLVAFRH